MNTQFTEKRFEKLEDFNLVYLIKFEQLRFQDLIQGAFLKKFDSKVTVKTLFGKKIIDNPEIPEKVIQSFNFGEEMVLDESIIYKRAFNSDGEVYYDSYMDATELVNSVMDLPVLKYTLKTISSLLGKSVMSKDLLALPGFITIDNVTYGSISLGLEELSEKGNKVRTCKIVLNIVKDNVMTSVDLAVLNYSIYGRRL
jgi:hypothetical protein